MTNRLTEIMQLGQAICYDNIRRAMLTSGDLAKKIEEDDLRGVTSNPTIFEKAITGSTDYDEQLRSLVQAGKSVSEIYEDLVTADIGNAADILRPVYDRTDGVDGYISLEVNPGLAYQKFKDIFHGQRFAELKAKGAQVQRCLWASTGTKNPHYSDVLYVDNLIGPETVNTVPPATYTAIRDHGRVALTLEEGLEECRSLIGELADVGIDLKAVTEKLQKD